jgi:hypothetical protein
MTGRESVRVCRVVNHDPLNAMCCTETTAVSLLPMTDPDWAERVH